MADDAIAVEVRIGIPVGIAGLRVVSGEEGAEVGLVYVAIAVDVAGCLLAFVGNAVAVVIAAEAGFDVADVELAIAVAIVDAGEEVDGPRQIALPLAREPR